MEQVVVIAGVVAVLVVGIAFFWRETQKKSRWGIKFGRAPCPRCGTPLPLMRMPSSKEEAMWGGWTCPKCGCKVDKYGKERV